MAPAQSLASAEEEGKPKVLVKPEAPEVNGDCKEGKDDGSGLVCENNCEDSGFYGDSLCVRGKISDGCVDEDVDVLGCEGGSSVESVKVEDPDATEQSSSFGNTFSGSDDGAKLNSSDVEVDSQFSVENGEQPVSDGFGRLFKKKKVTAHWRRFISPIMWRCQWLELRMNEFHSQASLYDKELAAYKHEKQLQSKMIELDDSVSRSVPIACQSHRKRAMKRRKRKRNEDTVDLSSYMSNHNIFSYYENKKSETDGHSVDDDCGNEVDEMMKGTDDHDWSVLGFRGSESSLEQILLDIEAVQSRVHKLKTHLTKVMCRNAREITSAPGSFFPGDPPTSYAQSPSCSPRNVGERPIGSLNTPPHHVSEYEMEDMVMPESAVSSYGDAADLDIIGNTMGLLSAANVRLNQHHIEDLCKDMAEDVLINNRAADEELQNFEVSHTREKPQELVKEEAGSSTEDESAAPKFLVLGPGPEKESVVTQQPVLKPCYTGKKRGRKPKRKRRGGSVTGWKSERLQKRRLVDRTGYV